MSVGLRGAGAAVRVLVRDRVNRGWNPRAGAGSARCALQFALEPEAEGALRFPSDFYLVHVKRSGGKTPALVYISAKCGISLYFTESG